MELKSRWIEGEFDDDGTIDGLTAGFAGCPHVDRNDARCGTRFSINRIDQAFSVCFGSFHGCPMFHRINGELRSRAQHVDETPLTLPFVAVTVHANHRRHQPLRATGT